MFVDAHCHLAHSDFEKDFEEVVARALAAGVKKMYCTGGMKGDSEKIIKMCSSRASLKPVIGIDPHEATKLSREEVEAELDFIGKHHKQIAAIGEIGLDYHHFTDEKDKVKQIAVFTQQLELARTLDLPVVIHSRKAEEKIIDFLIAEKFKNFMMHCFLVKNLASKAVSAGGIVSLPTIKSKNRKQIMKNLPLASMVCETDSPYLWQSGRNEPANVVEVYQEMSKVRGETIDKLAEQVLQNSEEFFR